MISAIIWNIRGGKIQKWKAIHRLRNLINMNNIQFFAILEPMIDKNKIEGYKRFLGYENCLSNDNGKIWCFWIDYCKAIVISNEEQQITICMEDSINNSRMYITRIHAKCTIAERKDLWVNLENLDQNIDAPWCIGGDFNTILAPEEKIGGRPHRDFRSFDFANCTNICGMEDGGYVGSNFTWYNNRRPSKRILKKLDRIMVNDLWDKRFQNIYIRHLVRTGSDHRLLVKCNSDQTTFTRYVRFLNFWTDQNDFMDIVK